jgi:dTDP-4-dehydrorhamnose reductase
MRQAMLPGPILVIGATGMLGRAVVEALRARGLPFSVAGRERVDLARAQSLRSGVPAGTGAVINCSGWTNVDLAESQEAEATQVNGHGVGALAQRCRELGAVLVHYSTDYVFSGDATAPYAVDQPRAPLNAYGRSKALGEELLEAEGARGAEYILIRTSWVYAPWGKNFVRTILGAAQKRPVLRVVNDQRGRPSSAEQLAENSLRLLEAGGRGAFHLSDGGECTWFDFASRVIARAGLSCQVDPCTSAEYPSPARRPSYSVLDLSRTEASIGPCRSWQESLDAVVPRIDLGGGAAR